jgi:four helix bundle protein
MSRSSSQNVEKDELASRTKAFAVRVIHMYESLPKTVTAQVLGKQALRSGTSVGAHYREALRVRSKVEFARRVEVGLQDLEESKYWLELLVESQAISAAKLSNLLEEAEQISALLAASVKPAKAVRKK